MSQAASPMPLDTLLRPEEDDDGTFDLCDQHDGRYLDVVRNDVTSTWRGLYDTREVVGPQPDRETARAKLLEWLLHNVLPKPAESRSRGGAGRGQGRKPLQAGEVTVPATLRMTPSQRAKLRRLGGAAWVRARIDEAQG